MWLINVDTLKLELHIVDFEINRPAYAILSHTWGDEEITFQDFRSKPARELQFRSGYRKVVATCKEAKRQELQYAWIDTCCIDKTSSAELSEAINSMYKWYRDSSICFAHLSDVHYDAEADSFVVKDLETDSSFSAKLRASRWFTRGWTLQELIAPERVMFFDATWIGLTDRHDLAPLLASITGIDPIVLRNWERHGRQYELSQFSVARRMSWASRRVTTRLEDEAYCLLGLFEVNMPLIYGEGSGAFRRLQEEIIRVSSDQSIFAWDDVRRLRGGLLALRPRAFRECGSIVLLPMLPSHTSYEMRNDGLHIKLPVLSAPDESCCSAFAVLNCRKEDDYRGQLALNLHDRFPDVQNAGFTPPCADGRFVKIMHHSRLSVVACEQVMASPQRSIVVSSRPTEVPRVVADPTSQHPDFVVVKTGEDWQDGGGYLRAVRAGPKSNISTGYIRLWDLKEPSNIFYDGVAACLFDFGSGEHETSFMMTIRIGGVVRIVRPAMMLRSYLKLEIFNAGFVSRTDFENIDSPTALLRFDKLDKTGVMQEYLPEEGPEHMAVRSVLLRLRSPRANLDVLLTRQNIMGEVVTVLEVPASDRRDPFEASEPVSNAAGESVPNETSESVPDDTLESVATDASDSVPSSPA